MEEAERGEYVLACDYDAKVARLTTALQAIADDGWLYYGEEGPSDVQELVYAVLREGKKL